MRDLPSREQRLIEPRVGGAGAAVGGGGNMTQQLDIGDEGPERTKRTKCALQKGPPGAANTHAGGGVTLALAAHDRSQCRRLQNHPRCMGTESGNTAGGARYCRDDSSVFDLETSILCFVGDLELRMIRFAPTVESDDHLRSLSVPLSSVSLSSLPLSPCSACSAKVVALAVPDPH